MKRVIRRYEVTDEEWERLKKYFPVRQEGTLGRPRKEPREILNGIFWIVPETEGISPGCYPL